MSRRKLVCIPPRYPGNPDDYIYVNEHCRKRNDQKSLRSRERSAVNALREKVRARPEIALSSFGNTRAGAAIGRALQIIDLQPDFILHLVSEMKSAKMRNKFPDVDRRYAEALKTWKKLKVPNSVRTKFVVFSLAF